MTLNILLLLSWNIAMAANIQGVFIARDNNGAVYGKIELLSNATFVMSSIENVTFTGEYVLAVQTKRGEADLSQPTSILFYTADKKHQSTGTITYKKEQNATIIRYKGRNYYLENNLKPDGENGI